MKKLFLALLITIISFIGFNNSFATQYIYEYRELTADTVLKLTYQETETDVQLISVEIIDNSGN